MKKVAMAVLGVVAVAGSAIAAGPAETVANGKAYQCIKEAEFPRAQWQRVLSLGTLSEKVMLREETSVAPDTFAVYKAEVSELASCQNAMAEVAGHGSRSVRLACQVAEGQVVSLEVDNDGGSCGYTWYRGKL